MMTAALPQIRRRTRELTFRWKRWRLRRAVLRYIKLFGDGR